MQETLQDLNSLLFILIGIGFLAFLLFKIGKLLFYRYQEKKKFKEIIASGIRTIDQMDGLQFEIFLKKLFEELGYRTKGTKKTQDFGADLFLTGKDNIVIQAKRYGMNNRVGIKAIMEVHFAKTYYGANKAWVITNSLFTKSAKEGAAKAGITLMDRQELQGFINKVKPATTPEKVYEEVEPQKRTCPVCKSELVVRQSKTNTFFGCSNYPKCTHTEPINKD